MQLDEYRMRVELFSEELNRDYYLYFSGQKQNLESARIYSEYSDLFSLETIDDLKKAYAAIPSAAQRNSIKKLITFSTENYLRMITKDLTAMINEAERSTQLEWNGRPMGFYASYIALANEASKAARRKLYKLRSDAIAELNPLRRERLQIQSEGCSSLGYKNSLEAHTEIHSVVYSDLARDLNVFLDKTETYYTKALADALLKEINLDLEEAHDSDIGYLTRLTRFDNVFESDGLIKCYHTTFERLGIDTTRKTNLEFDIQPRATKHARAFCAPIKIPDEIKLVMNPRGGHTDYATLFHEAGHAQHYGWTSRDLSVENRYCGDRALGETYAFLFHYMTTDLNWLEQMFRFREPESFVSLERLFKLYRLRKCSARINYEVYVHTNRSIEPDVYSDLLFDATKVRHDSAEYLYDLEHPFHAADCVRGSMLESLLENHLKTRFGKNWFASKKAGDFLKELWETGGQYSADEMASQIGLGRLEVSVLLEEFR